MECFENVLLSSPLVFFLLLFAGVSGALGKDRGESREGREEFFLLFYLKKKKKKKKGGEGREGGGGDGRLQRQKRLTSEFIGAIYQPAEQAKDKGASKEWGER